MNHLTSNFWAQLSGLISSDYIRDPLVGKAFNQREAFLSLQIQLEALPKD